MLFTGGFMDIKAGHVNFFDFNYAIYRNKFTEII